MYRSFWIGLALAASVSLAPAQDRRAGRINLEHYTIDAEVNPNTQSLSAKVSVRFTPADNNVSSAAFELNNALNVSRVTDASGRQIPASRSQQDFTVRLSFDQPLAKGAAQDITFNYDGHLTGNEDSPVYGIKFAAIHNDYAYLMYPARWFPVSGYTGDRFSADMNITVPNGYQVLASGLETKQSVGDKVVYSYKFEHPSFPGSIAVVRDQGTPVSSEGVTTTVFFRGAEKEVVQPYGQEFGKIMSYFTGVFGLPPYANLTVIETESGAPNGYAAPGLVFLSPRGIGKQVNSKLLANQISRQWWDVLMSPASRNHLWLDNGFAAWSEQLWLEHSSGPAAAEAQLKDVMVESLTVDNVPIIQASRLEDYSPELWALTGSKGASVLGMLRFIIGDEKFFATLKEYVKENTWKAVSTETFHKVAEQVSGQDLGYFFIEWIESSGAPEFKLEYTVYRTQKGFRVMGKIAQDLDTFRMPVDLKIETEGNPEEKRVEVVGTSSEFTVDTFGKPKSVTIDPNGKRAALRQPGARSGGDPARRAVRRVQRVRRCTEGIPEGPRGESQQLAGALPHCRGVLPPEQLPVGGERIPRGAQRRSGAQVDRSLGAHQPGQDLRHHRAAGARGERVQPGTADARQHAGRAGRSRALYEEPLRAQA